MPSRAFCSDESQGFPIILITKRFGTFPFNHGQVGGVIATDRHGPHAEHGKDMVIIQASHVGYDPETKTFGTYRRLQCEQYDMSANCGKIDIPPQPGQLIPLTKFVPWVAYIQEANGHHYTLEQAELMALLKAQSNDNPDQIDLEQAITEMGRAQEIRITQTAS